MSVFNTEFLHKILTMIVNEVSEPHIVFVGSVDSWPENLFKSKYATMIFNTDYENEVGEHWIAVYIDGKMNLAYIFDSLPVHPFPQNIIKKLSKICDKIYDINPQRYILQRPDFPLCEIYCLVFLERYSKNQPFLLFALLFAFIASVFDHQTSNTDAINAKSRKVVTLRKKVKH